MRYEAFIIASSTLCTLTLLHVAHMNGEDTAYGMYRILTVLSILGVVVGGVALALGD